MEWKLDHVAALAVAVVPLKPSLVEWKQPLMPDISTNMLALKPSLVEWKQGCRKWGATPIPDLETFLGGMETGQGKELRKQGVVP